MQTAKKETRENILFEDIEYAKILAECNLVVGRILDIEILHAKSFKKAFEKLAELSNDELKEKICDQDHQASLARYLSTKAQPFYCPVWNQVATDLHDSITYKNWLVKKSRRYWTLGMFQLPKKSSQESTPFRDQVAREFGFILFIMHSIVCGRISAYVEMYTNRKKEAWTWLNIALHENNSIPGRVIRKERGQRVRLQSPEERLEETKSKRGWHNVTVNSEVIKDLEHEASPEHQPDRIAELNDLRDIIDQALSKLDPNERTILDLRRIEGLSWEGLADRLGVSVHIAKKKFINATTSLRRILSEMGHREL